MSGALSEGQTLGNRLNREQGKGIGIYTVAAAFLHFAYSDDWYPIYALNVSSTV